MDVQVEMGTNFSHRKAPEAWSTPRRCALFDPYRAARSVLACGSLLPLFRRPHETVGFAAACRQTAALVQELHNPAFCRKPLRHWLFNALGRHGGVENVVVTQPVGEPLRPIFDRRQFRALALVEAVAALGKNMNLHGNFRRVIQIK